MRFLKAIKLLSELRIFFLINSKTVSEYLYYIIIFANTFTVTKIFQIVNNNKKIWDLTNL